MSCFNLDVQRNVAIVCSLIEVPNLPVYVDYWGR